MKFKSSEKGQALIIIAIAAVGLFAFAGLAIDGGRNYSQKRHAQNAADTAAYAAALAYTRQINTAANITAAINTAAQDRATSNGFNNDGTTNTVTVTTTDIAANTGLCPQDAIGKEITVTIVSTIETTLTRVINRDTLTSAVTATARGCGYTIIDPFGGAAVAGVNPGPGCAFDSGNSHSSHWTLKDGGIFSNGCAYSSFGGSVTLDPGECVQSVGTATNFTCMQPYNTSSALPWPSGIAALMPPNPCVAGGVGLPQGSGSTFSNGVYCISDMDALDKKDVVLNNATLYVTDLNFSLKFAGGGGFSGTPTTAGTYAGSDTYAGYYMIVAFNPSNPCPVFNAKGVQTMVLRGNSGGTFSGTILAPSACIDVRGNGEPSGINTQLIGYNVTSNGNAEIFIRYNPNPDLLTPLDPTISLIK